jgi:hypothetical protein
MLKKTLQFFADEFKKYLILKKSLSSDTAQAMPGNISRACHAKTYTRPDPNDTDKKEMISKCSTAFLTFQLLPYDKNCA